jgi:hypothetical protein
VYDPKPLFVLKGSSGFAEGFLIALLGRENACLDARSFDSVLQKTGAAGGGV